MSNNIESSTHITSFEALLSIIGKIWDIHKTQSNSAAYLYETARENMKKLELSSKDILKIRLLNTLLKYSEIFINYKYESIDRTINQIHKQNEQMIKEEHNFGDMSICLVPKVEESSSYDSLLNKRVSDHIKEKPSSISDCSRDQNNQLTSRSSHEYDNNIQNNNSQRIENIQSLICNETINTDTSKDTNSLSESSRTLHDEDSKSTLDENKEPFSTTSLTSDTSPNNTTIPYGHLSLSPIKLGQKRTLDQESSRQSIKVMWDDVIGNNEAKQLLYESCILPLLFPKSVFVGIRNISFTTLLYGPPGTGKTLLAKALANESNRFLIELHPSCCMSKWIGESEMIIRNIFDSARKKSPSLIFIDELDSLTFTRSNNDDLSSRRVLSELLIQIGSLESTDNVYILGTTNRIEDIDPAILRRFQRIICVPLPSFEDRLDMLVHYMKGIDNTLSLEDYQYIANMTNGWNGVDIRNLVRETSLIPLRETCQQILYENNNKQINNPHKFHSQCSKKQFQTTSIKESNCSNIRPITFIDFLETVEVLNNSSSYSWIHGINNNIGNYSDSTMVGYVSRSKLFKQSNI